MSQYSNDDVLYSENYGSILSDGDRKVIEDKLTKKIVYIPKDLMDRFKELKYNYIKRNVLNFNETMIIRVGTRLVLEGLSNIVLSLLSDEESLEKSLWMLYNIEYTQEVRSNNMQGMYSQNIRSVSDLSSKMDYNSYSIRKTVYCPFSLLTQVKNARMEIEKETEEHWIKENSFFKIGMRLMLDILNEIDLISIKEEDDLYKKARSVIGTL